MTKSSAPDIYTLNNPGRNPKDRKELHLRAKELGINLSAEFKTMQEAQSVADKATDTLRVVVVVAPGFYC